MKDLKSNITAVVSLIGLTGLLTLSACHSDDKEKADQQRAQQEQTDIEIPTVETFDLEKSKS
jgi:uncharacterized alpha/beta hydrolase family protein